MEDALHQDWRVDEEGIPERRRSASMAAASCTPAATSATPTPAPASGSCRATSCSPTLVRENPSARARDSSIDHTLTDFVNSCSDLEFKSNGTNVRCTVSNHSMPLDLEIICGYLGGRKYKVTKERESADFSNFGNAVIDHPTQSGKLLCPLTGKVLNQNEDEVRLHLSGKAYQKKLNSKHGAESEPPLFGQPFERT